jgi:osmoprotectant transport system ATP-binding protein
MNAGHIEQAATPLAVLATPATDYVAQLLDTHDVVRRLQLLTVRDATKLDTTVKPGSANAVSIDATLREALSDLLASEGRIAVSENGTVIGSLGFDDIRAAIARPVA